MANAGVRPKREILLDTGYFVEKGILSDSDIAICKDRLREIALRIDFYRSLGNESKSTTDLFGR